MATDTFKTLRDFTPSPGKKGCYHSLAALEAAGLGKISRLPVSIRIVLESLVRFCDGKRVTEEHVRNLAAWEPNGKRTTEIPFIVVRIVLQDLIGFGALNDLSAMRAAAERQGLAASKIEPLVPVDVVVDHSVEIDVYNAPDAVQRNQEIEFKRNAERYSFVKWAQGAFDTVRVVPPGNGIIHQINMEYLSRGVWEKDGVWFPDTVFGTDSHTTMVNGIGVVAWGVGGIEAEAGMLGQPNAFLTPDVVGCHMTGKLREGVTATDLVLTVTQMLRKKGVVGKFVEYYGPGLDELSLEDRATIANMAPEYGATCGFFPIDAETVRFLKNTARKPARVALVEKYAKAQGLWRSAKSEDPVFTDTLDLDMTTVEPCMAGPMRPQDRVPLSGIAGNFAEHLINTWKKEDSANKRATLEGSQTSIGHGDVVIAAITSCTNTSNPNVMIGAGLVAQNAVKRGLKVRPWVKTSLAPGSQVVTDYLAKAGLDKALDKLGFTLAGYGCTTCIGNSGPLPEPVAKAVTEADLVAAAVISGNRNFEGRVHPQVRANYLASPMLVVAYALAGSVNMDLTKEPVGYDPKNEPVYLKDIWPSPKEISAAIAKAVKPASFKKRYGDVFKGDANWKKVKLVKGQTYQWDISSTYVKNPPFFEGMTIKPKPVEEIKGARVLAVFGDSITTDHISPAGNIKPTAPGGVYLSERQVSQKDFNSYGSRRGNFELMERGTFANIRIRNEMMGGAEGGNTIYYATPDAAGEAMSIFDAAQRYKADGHPSVVFGGKEYGTGSSRDWAAKGPALQGVRAVITESFERIHRSNLIGMGVAPFCFEAGRTRKDYGITGREVVDIAGLAGDLKPRQQMEATVHRPDGSSFKLPLYLMILTADEVAYYKNGGILPYVLRNLLAA